MTTSVTSVNMFDGRDDLRLIPEVIPNFVLVRLVALSHFPVRDIHVMLLPLDTPVGQVHTWPVPRLLSVSPEKPAVVPIAYESAGTHQCALVVNFVADDGDILQCRDVVTLVPSPFSRFAEWVAWQGISPLLSRQEIRIEKDYSASEVVKGLAEVFRASFFPVSGKTKSAEPEFTWGALGPVILANFSPPERLIVQTSPEVEVTAPARVTAVISERNAGEHALVRDAFETGRLVEHAQVLLDLNWAVADFLDLTCTLKGLLQRLGVPSPLAPAEEIVRGKKSLGELSPDEREGVISTLRDVRWAVAGQVG